MLRKGLLTIHATTPYIIGNCSKYPKNSRTVSVWFKIINNARNNSLLGYGGNDCGSSFFTVFNENNHPNEYTVSGHCEVNNCSTSNNYPPPSGWNNMIITTGFDTTKFYLNGILINTFNNVSFNNTYVNGKRFVFGSISGPDGTGPFSDLNVDYLIGNFDDIIIYDTALNNTQILDLFNHFSKATSIAACNSYTWNGTTYKSSGIYTKTFVTASGCDSVATLNLQIPKPTYTFTKTDSICYGTTTGSISINASGGIAPYKFRLGTTGGYQASNTFTGLKAGNYRIYIIDSIGCSAFTSYLTIASYKALTYSYSKSDASCHDSSTGSLSVAAANGMAPYSYKLGPTGAYQSSGFFTGLKAGN